MKDRAMTKLTSTARLFFMFVLLPIFYLWIPYEIISSRYVYSFNIGVLRYLGICFITLGIIIVLLQPNFLLLYARLVIVVDPYVPER